MANNPDDFRRQVFIEWLCTPLRDREPRNQADFAIEHGLTEKTLREWKKDRDFVLAWETYYLTTIGSPERKQALLDTLYKTGCDADDPRHVQAAKTYMELVEGVKPQQINLTVRPAAELTDAQLDAALGRVLTHERDVRNEEQAS